MNEYRTKDLFLATVLAIKFPVKQIDKTDERRMFFVFDDSDKLQKRVDDYWNGNLLENPISLFNEMKGIKSRMYDNGY